jgi:hypothetical protein
LRILGVNLGAPVAERGELGRYFGVTLNCAMYSARRPGLARRLLRVQKWQSKRLLRSHADLHANPRYRLAVEFFFNELYGGDARRRDSDLIKVQGAMTRLLPREASARVLPRREAGDRVAGARCRESQARCPVKSITVARYAEAYRAAGRQADRPTPARPDDRSRSLLDRVVRKPMVRGLVKLARGPAHAAGFGLLQEFLERGLDAFEAMPWCEGISRYGSGTGEPGDDGDLQRRR